MENQFPEGVTNRVKGGEYDLILLNDTHLLPWLTNTAVFKSDTFPSHIHIDLHEWFDKKMLRNTRGRFLIQPYYAWGRRQIINPVVMSRSVAGGTAQMYVDEFKIPKPLLVRNVPSFEALQPSEVDDSNIKLVHHGLAGWTRGFREMIDAMYQVDSRFSLTFMLAGSPSVIDEIKDYARPLGTRVNFVNAVPMVDLARSINPYDVEVMFFPPRTMNLQTTLPNKLFEAIQGRLALVTGPTEMMRQVVDAYSNGVVTTGWSPAELAAAINTLTADNVRHMKSISHQKAELDCAENEKFVFFSSIGFPLSAEEAHA